MSDVVDIVSVCVKVPDHHTLVLAAINAGKHVYCEWPLGCDAAEAEALAGAAERRGIHHAIGLQARMSVAVGEAARRIRAGEIGRLLTARIVSTTAAFGPSMASQYAYFNDPSTGANLATIVGGHTLDVACLLLGDIKSFHSMGSIQYPEIRLVDTDQTCRRRTLDHLFLQTRHESGCVLSMEVGSNRSASTPFSFEIIGTEGALMLRGGDPRGFQAGQIVLESEGQRIAPDAIAPVTGAEAAAVNVASLYACFAHNINNGERTVPNFVDAVALTKSLANIIQSGWPPT